MHNMKSIYLILLLGYVSFAQTDDKEKVKALKSSNNYIWEANKELSEKKFVTAEANYRKAISKSKENVAGPYNLGNAYYDQETYGEAFTRFKEAGEMASDKKDKHRAYHNMGNVFMKSKEYQKAVDAYKEALRNDPTDEETRYNLALAKEMLKKQQEEDKNNNQDNKDQQDKKDEEKEDKKEGDNKEGDDGDNEDNDKEDKGENEENKEGEGDEKEEQKKQPDEGDEPAEQQEQQQPRPNQLSPQQIKNILEAMQNEEKKVQDKMDAQKVKGVKVKTEKDW